MAASSILAFWAIAFLLIVVPGPDWAFTIGAAARGRAVLPAVGGLVVGYAVMTAVVAAGIGALVARSGTALTGLTILGGAYLVWLGIRTLARAAPPVPVAGGSTMTRWGTLAQGVAVSGLNPKGLLLFVALLPQFTDRGGSWPIADQVAVLGLVFMLTCAAFYLGLGTFAGTIVHDRPALARLVTRLAGSGMIVVGTLLLADRLIG